ncbi:TPA: hypothetical protein ACFNMI_001984 [Neisseria bacilliformis]|uniref:hypothetical protein n=1 Tax=Neisseria bacilliformis TaxID=267212 RepID=UPI0028F164DE|nr:hypothetical protein [Neisseria bacilliformis]
MTEPTPESQPKLLRSHPPPDPAEVREWAFSDHIPIWFYICMLVCMLCLSRFLIDITFFVKYPDSRIVFSGGGGSDLNIVSTLVLLVFSFSCGGLSLLILYFDPVWQYTRKRREFIRLEDDGIRFDTLTSGKRFLRWEHIRNATVLCYRSGKGSLLELFLYIEHDVRRYGSNRIITAETCLDLLLITPSYPFTRQCDTAYALAKVIRSRATHPAAKYDEAV